MERQETIKFLADHYGWDSQSRQCIEEMGELIQALNKYWRKELKCGKRTFDNAPVRTPNEMQIIEEIADVEVCLDQLKYLLGCRNMVSDIKDQKADRELHRIINGKGTC